MAPAPRTAGSRDQALLVVAQRKAKVAAAVEGGLFTLEEARERYDLSLQEFAAWQRGLDRAGLVGWRATKAQHYRTEWERPG